MILNRHLERIKVMQALYAFCVRPVCILEELKQDLNRSLKGTEHLYLSLLFLLKEVRKKMLVTNKSLAFNKALEIIDENFIPSEKLARFYSEVWEHSDQFITRLTKKILQTERVKKYESSDEERTLEEDAKFLVKLYRKVIAVDPDLFDCIEAFKISWQDDFPYVNTFLIKTIFSIGEGKLNQEIPYFSREEEHYEFAQDLFEKTALNYDALLKHIDGKTPNWEQDRIALIDKIIICMAIAEFLYFDDIPRKVTLNEYVDISKEYSGSKSSIFINGILDVISKNLINEGKSIP